MLWRICRFIYFSSLRHSPHDLRSLFLHRRINYPFNGPQTVSHVWGCNTRPTILANGRLLIVRSDVKPDQLADATMAPYKVPNSPLCLCNRGGLALKLSFFFSSHEKHRQNPCLCYFFKHRHIRSHISIWITQLGLSTPFPPPSDQKEKPMKCFACRHQLWCRSPACSFEPGGLKSGVDGTSTGIKLFGCVLSGPQRYWLVPVAA